jgi:hypothetical protein
MYCKLQYCDDSYNAAQVPAAYLVGLATCMPSTASKNCYARSSSSASVSWRLNKEPRESQHQLNAEIDRQALRLKFIDLLEPCRWEKLNMQRRTHNSK